MRSIWEHVHRHYRYTVIFDVNYKEIHEMHNVQSMETLYYDRPSIVICVDNTGIISRLLDVRHEKENCLFQEI